MQRLNDGSVTSVSRQISWALDFTGENRSHKPAQILLPVSITFSELMEGLLAWGSPPMCPGGSSGEVKGAVNLPLCWLRRSSDPQKKTSPNLLCVSGCYDEHGPVEVAPPSGELQELQSRGTFSQQWHCLCTMSCQNLCDAGYKQSLIWIWWTFLQRAVYYELYFYLGFKVWWIII